MRSAEHLFQLLLATPVHWHNVLTKCAALVHYLVALLPFEARRRHGDLDGVRHDLRGRQGEVRAAGD